MNAKRLRGSNRTGNAILARCVGACPLILVLAANLALLAQSKPEFPGTTGQPLAATPLPGGTKTTTDKTGRTGSAVRLRDPFKLPVPLSAEARNAHMLFKGPRPPGKRGLIVGELKIRGVVRGGSDSQASEQDSRGTPPQMIAVVTGTTNLAYFLHVNDVIYDGVVSRITADAVFFREDYLDSEGQFQSREVVKRLGSVPAEAK